MKIDRFIFSANSSPERLRERMEVIGDVKANYQNRAEALGQRLIGLAGALWRELSETLTVDGCRPTLPKVPELELFVSV